MKLYTIAELNQGLGVFNHTMHRAGEFPSRYTGMSGAVGIGFMAAAMGSGLKRDEINSVLDCYVDDNTAQMLHRLRSMYNGSDRRIHLWDETAKLSRPSLATTFTI